MQRRLLSVRNTRKKSQGQNGALKFFCSAVTSSSVTLWNLRKLETCEFGLIFPKLRDSIGLKKSTSFLESTIAAHANRSAAVCRAARMWSESPLNHKIKFCGIMWDSRHLPLQKIKVHTQRQTGGDAISGNRLNYAD